MAQCVIDGTTPAPPIDTRERVALSGRRSTLPVALWLALITATALAVRIYGLTEYGIWTDEAYHLALIRLPTVGDMLGAVLANPPSDPLYVLLLRGWAGLFGTDDSSVRMLSVVLGTLTVPTTFALGTTLAGRAAGLLAALLVALSPYALEFSQEAALYALAALFTTLALALGIKWQRANVGAFAYVLVAAFALYSHYLVAGIVALYVLGSALPYFRAASKVPFRRFLVANGISFALWLPWLLPLTVSWASVDVTRSSLPQDMTVNYVIGAIGQYTAGTSALLVGNWTLMLISILSAATLLLVAWWHSGLPERRHARLLMAIAAPVFLVPAVAAAVTGRWLFVPHFMVFLLPALFAVAAAGVVWAVADRDRSLTGPIAGWAAPAALAALLLVQALGVTQFFARPPHGADGLRDLAAVLQSEARPGEPVLVTPPALSMSLAQYFDGEIRGLPEDFDLYRVYLRYDGEDWQRRSLDLVTEVASRAPRFWLVYRPERDEAGRLLAAIKVGFKQSHSSAYEFATLYRFEVP